MLSYDRLSKKPLLFKSFTGLSVQQFDDIYKIIESKYAKYEIKRLSHGKHRRERAVGAGRRFKLGVKDRFVMVLIYYRLYITYTLTGLLFDLDQSNVCRDVQKIEGLIRQCLPIPQKLYRITKRLKTKEEVEEYFPNELKSSLPIKREKNQILTKEEEEYNKNHSRRMIVAEHAICRIKKYRIMNDVFRNRLRKYDKISDMVSRLVNYRIINPA